MPESVDEALCFGWIDSFRRRVSETSYANRLTQRKAGSTWSAVNINRVKELIRLGRVQAAGLKAFERRTDERSAIYSYEQRESAKLSEAFEKQLRAKRKAWNFLSSAGSLAPVDGGILDHEREERGYQVEAACQAHQGF